MDKNTKDILASLAFIKDKVEQLPTKDDVRKIIRDEVPGIIQELVPGIVTEELKPIRAELTSIRRDLDNLSTKVANMIGFSKEIDHALERIACIEKHLGLAA